MTAQELLGTMVVRKRTYYRDSAAGRWFRVTHTDLRFLTDLLARTRGQEQMMAAYAHWCAYTPGRKVMPEGWSP